MKIKIQLCLVIFLLNTLTACGDNSFQPIYLLPYLSPKFYEISEEEKARQAAKTELQQLIKNKDAQASAYCILRVCSMVHVWGNFPNYEENMLLSSNTVIESWQADPKNIAQVIALMEAYYYLARNIRSTDPEQARKYFIKSLNYLQSEHVRTLDETLYLEYPEVGFFSFLTSTTMRHNLGALVKRDHEHMICTYPNEIKSSLMNPKFSEESRKYILQFSCLGLNSDINFKEFIIRWE